MLQTFTLRSSPLALISPLVHDVCATLPSDSYVYSPPEINLITEHVSTLDLNGIKRQSMLRNIDGNRVSSAESKQSQPQGGEGNCVICLEKRHLLLLFRAVTYLYVFNVSRPASKICTTLVRYVVLHFTMRCGYLEYPLRNNSNLMTNIGLDGCHFYLSLMLQLAQS